MQRPPGGFPGTRETSLIQASQLHSLMGAWPGIAAGASTVFVNNMFYAAVLDYKTLDRNVLQALGNETPPSVGPTIGLEGGAPYWRLALERTWDVYSLMFGTFGMTANVIQDVTIPMPADKFTDVVGTPQSEYLSDVHFITARISYIYEWEKLDGSFSLGNAANLKNQLAGIQCLVTYAYDAGYLLGSVQVLLARIFGQDDEWDARLRL